MRTRLATAAALAAVVALAAVEGALRLVLPSPEAAESYDFARYDELLGWSGRPGATGAGVHLNSRGLRDHEHGAKSGRRILCLGDSFTWGANVSDAETYPKVLERLTGIETVNAGVCAWGNAQELLWLERDGFAYAPDVVMLGFYMNDFADNSNTSFFGHGRPAYVLAGGRLELTGVPVPRPPSSLAATMTRHLLTAQVALAGWRWLDDGFLRSADAAPISRARLHATVVAPPLAEDVTAALLGEMKRRCEERGIPFIILLCPSQCIVQQASSPVACREQDAVTYASVARICSTAGIRTVEPLNALRAAEVAGTPTFTSPEWHWNAAGHEIAGRALAAALNDIR